MISFCVVVLCLYTLLSLHDHLFSFLFFLSFSRDSPTLQVIWFSFPVMALLRPSSEHTPEDNGVTLEWSSSKQPNKQTLNLFSLSLHVISVFINLIPFIFCFCVSTGFLNMTWFCFGRATPTLESSLMWRTIHDLEVLDDPTKKDNNPQLFYLIVCLVVLVLVVVVVVLSSSSSSFVW